MHVYNAFIGHNSETNNVDVAFDTYHLTPTSGLNCHLNCTTIDNLPIINMLNVIPSITNKNHYHDHLRQLLPVRL